MLAIGTLGAWLLVERFDAPPMYHRYHMLAIGREVFAAEKATQQPPAGGRALDVRPVDPAHQREIGARDRSRLIVHDARDGFSSDAQRRIGPANLLECTQSTRP